MDCQIKLQRAITEFRNKNRYVPEEVYVTEEFSKKLSEEIREVCVYVLGRPTPLIESDPETKLVFCGVKIKEIKDFIITK